MTANSLALQYMIHVHIFISRNCKELIYLKRKQYAIFVITEQMYFEGKILKTTRSWCLS